MLTIIVRCLIAFCNFMIIESCVSVHAYYDFTMVPAPNSNDYSETHFPFTLSTLSHLEPFTVRAEVYLLGPMKWTGFIPPFPQIIYTCLQDNFTPCIETIDAQLRFSYQQLPTCYSGDVAWAPLVRLVEGSHLPSIHLNLMPSIFSLLHLQALQHWCNMCGKEFLLTRCHFL